MAAPQLSSEVVEAVSHRLAAVADLRLPGQLTKAGAEPPSQEKRAHYLRALLERDPGVFLERHGDMLSGEELAAFEPLRGDYEVDFYLKLLEDRRDTHKQDTAAKNRRLAYMNRLLQEGTFFSDDAMRERQPWLHHQYVGQYTPPGEAGPSSGGAAGPPAASAAGLAGAQEAGGGGGDAPGERLSQSLLRHQDELEAMLARRAEQERYDMVEEESDSEEEEEEEEGVAGAGGQQGAAGVPGGGRGGGAGAAADGGAEEEGPGYVHISEAERQENADTFLDLMKERFLRGEEAGVDYKAIDADAGLDEDWQAEAGRDAEDKYFDED